MSRYSRSTTGRGQTYDNDRYGSSTRGQSHMYDDEEDCDLSSAESDDSLDDRRHNRRDTRGSSRMPISSSSISSSSSRYAPSSSSCHASSRSMRSTYDPRSTARHRDPSPNRGSRHLASSMMTSRMTERSHTTTRSRPDRDSRDVADSRYTRRQPESSRGMGRSSRAAFSEESDSGSDSEADYESRGSRRHGAGGASMQSRGMDSRSRGGHELRDPRFTGEYFDGMPVFDLEGGSGSRQRGGRRY